jgi:hypothetical protein
MCCVFGRKAQRPDLGRFIPKACLGREGRIHVECSLSCIGLEAVSRAQVPAARRRLGHDPEGRRNDVQGGGREVDRRLERQRGLGVRQGDESGSRPRRRRHAGPGRLRIVRESAGGCSHPAHPRAAPRRRYPHRPGQGDRRRREWAHAEAIRLAEAHRSGEADSRESEGCRSCTAARGTDGFATSCSRVASARPDRSRNAPRGIRRDCNRQHADDGAATDIPGNATRGTASASRDRAAGSGTTRWSAGAPLSPGSRSSRQPPATSKCGRSTAGRLCATSWSASRRSPHRGPFPCTRAAQPRGTTGKTFSSGPRAGAASPPASGRR